MKVLVWNCGSSSVKYELFEMSDETSLLEGAVERVGEPDATLWHQSHGPAAEPGPDPAPGHTARVDAPDHAAAIELAVEAMRATGTLGPADTVALIGHRVVHGGSDFVRPTLVDTDVLSKLEALAHLAPLHLPPNIAGIRATTRLFPGVPHVAVFDTAFHAGMPPRAYRYAVPREWFDRLGVRRYGFQGISHRFVAEETAAFLGRPLAELKLVTLHLGNGASAAAIDGGVSIDTSMGMTPLEGLVMGTRCGNIDAAVPGYAARELDVAYPDIERALNRESGLHGMCGAHDMRGVHEKIAAGDSDATLALDVFCYRIRCYIGAYAAALGGLDAIAFTAGIGENDPEVRKRACEGLAFLGVEIDDDRNQAPGAQVRAIGRSGAPVSVLVVPTDEERVIARESVALARETGLI